MQFEDCAELSRRSGFRLGCLIEHKENITLASCRSFLNRIASLVFSDYRLMGNFLSRCQTDIDTTKCGRLSEGKVITVALAFFPNISCTLLDCIFPRLRTTTLKGRQSSVSSRRSATSPTSARPRFCALPSCRQTTTTSTDRSTSPAETTASGETGNVETKCSSSNQAISKTSKQIYMYMYVYMIFSDSARM